MSTADDLEVLARTVHGEARGEPFEGALAVAWVVVNRSRMWAKRVRDICLQPWQFSAWNQKDPNLRVIATVSVDSDPEYVRSLAAAACALAHALPDPTGKATDYHTIERPSGVDPWPPVWAKDYIPTVRLGSHQFYRRT